MWLSTALFAVVAACGDDGGQAPTDAGIDATPDAHVPTFAECEADDEAFVRNAHLAALGYRPRSQAEADVYVQIMAGVRALAESQGEALDAKEVVLRAMMAEPAFVDRWTQQLMDALRVPRIEDQDQESCYGRSLRSSDDGALAAFVRDNPGTGGGDGGGAFTMLDLTRSAVVLDDVSPVYRAHLYALVSRPIPAANVPRVQAELARREDFGLVFDSVYLNRDLVCLGCHNSAGSVTFSEDPALNRHWALPGLFERSLWGADTGIEVERAHAAFRYDGFVDDLGDPGDHRPWDWSRRCGAFFPSGLPDDPAGIDGLFGSLSGQRLTVYDLEAALATGFDHIAQDGLSLGEGGAIADPDAAFAYMVAAAIVEAVWREVIGTPLTIANYFARNQESRDLLHTLTDSFIANRFSLQELLIDIVQTPYFNRLPPEAGCGAGPYNTPPVYDPWVTSDEDPERRLNGPADGVVALSGRTLMSAAYQALVWKPSRFQSFPELPSEFFFCQGLTCGQMASVCGGQGSCCVTEEILCSDPPGPNEPTSSEERAFQRGIGVFLKNGERGFRGLDFQARLVWEDRFGACDKPTADPDLVDVIVAESQAAPGSSVGDVAVALKDRLVGEPFVADGPERAAVEAIFAAPLESPASEVSDLEGATRALCGVLMSSPQFLLGGFAGQGGEVPRLTPAEFGFDAVCARVAARGLSAGLTMGCDGGEVAVGGP